MIQSVAVFCGSAEAALLPYKQQAAALGQALAAEKLQLIYGGGSTGLMGVLARATLNAGGQVRGYMPRFLYDQEGGNLPITHLQFVETMHERKQHMFEAADAFIVLPGGLGTLDETFEILTWKQIGLHQKYLIILNVDDYWTPLFDLFLDNIIRAGFLATEGKKLFTMVSTISEVIALLQTKQSHSDHSVIDLS